MKIWKIAVTFLTLWASYSAFAAGYDPRLRELTASDVLLLKVHQPLKVPPQKWQAIVQNGQQLEQVPRSLQSHSGAKILPYCSIGLRMNFIDVATMSLFGVGREEQSLVDTGTIHISTHQIRAVPILSGHTVKFSLMDRFYSSLECTDESQDLSGVRVSALSKIFGDLAVIEIETPGERLRPGSVVALDRPLWPVSQESFLNPLSQYREKLKQKSLIAFGIEQDPQKTLSDEANTWGSMEGCQVTTGSDGMHAPYEKIADPQQLTVASVETFPSYDKFFNHAVYQFRFKESPIEIDCVDLNVSGALGVTPSSEFFLRHLFPIFQVIRY